MLEETLATLRSETGALYIFFMKYDLKEETEEALIKSGANIAFQDDEGTIFSF